ncbi:hypothetical protein [Asinibacterium sp. OR53]|uniref:hypothetical protein n=1 Tax=Asinibacterium sp. OR53 TaxID=925409 RepID=UPI000564BE03|nr:hypothetical protein [Asinibacterium sp. OR53]
MASFKLDRTSFKAQTAAAAADHAAYYKNLSWQERLKVSSFLNSIAYNYPEDTPPKLDRTKFVAKSRPA